MQKNIMIFLFTTALTISNSLDSFAFRVVSESVLCPKCDEIQCEEITAIPEGCKLEKTKMDNGCPECCEKIVCPESNNKVEGTILNDCTCPSNMHFDGKECVNGIDEACAMLYDPVCGCNIMTYSNACAAWSKGVKRYTQGKCEIDLSSFKKNVKIICPPCIAPQKGCYYINQKEGLCSCGQLECEKGTDAINTLN